MNISMSSWVGERMLNEKKIRLMTRLAKFESKDGREDLEISRYYRTDYIGISLFKNFFWITIAYIIVLLLIAGYQMEYFMENLHKMNLPLVGACIIGGYIIILTIYMTLTYARCRLRYKRAEYNLEEYEKMLHCLDNAYSGKHRKSGKSKDRRTR